MICCVAGIAAACSNATYHVDGGPTPDAGGPMGVLTIESDSALTLTFGESTTLVARYTESGAPAAGTTIRFALDGRAHDATLSDISATTDAEGRVSTMLTAASTPSVFRVRASADRAAPVYVNVSVGNMGFGGLRVGAIYDGARQGATRRVVDVYSEASCADELPSSPDRTTALELETDVEAYFPVLPAGLRYAAVGRVLGPTGAVLAMGCVDGVEVLRDMEVRVDLAFDDQPLIVDGDYDVTIGMAPEASSGLASELARAAGDARIDAAETGGGLYLDALEDELRDLGADTAADALATERLGGAADASLDAQLDDVGVGPRASVDALVARIQSRLALLTLRGPLAIDASDGFDAAFGELTLALGPIGDPDSPPLAIDTSASGLALAPEAAWSFAPGDTEIGLDSLALALPLGTLTSTVIATEASARGYDDAAMLLRDGAGCDVLASWIAESPTVAPVCDGDCASAVCTRALGQLLDAMRAALAALDETHPSTDVSGSIVLLDDDGDLVVDQLLGESLEGAWWSPSLGTGDPLTGRLEGTRASASP